MASYQSRQRDPLLDHRVQAMLERRGRELFGLFLIALSLAFALMLMTYSASDPGWMVATDQPANNALGRLGAAVSSTLMTVSGLGSWGIPVVILAWGLRFASHQGADRAVARVVFAVIAVALGSVYAATLVPGSGWPHSFGLGGLFGDTILASLMGLIPGSAAIALKLLSLLVAVAFVAMMLFVTGFNLTELARVIRFLGLGLVVAYSGLMTALGKGAQGSVAASLTVAERWKERKASRAERAAEDYASRQTARQAARAAAVGTARMAEAVVEDDERPASSYMTPRRAPALASAAAAAVGAPVAAAAAAPATFGRPAALRADVRPQPEPVKERGSLLSRLPALIRREPEPEHELIEPPLTADMPAPPADRIQARISSVIRSRSGVPDQQISPITAAIQRREPSLTARAAASAATPRPSILRAPLVADTRPAPPRPSIVQHPGLRLSEPPVVSPQAAAWEEDWDEEDLPISAAWDAFDAMERGQTAARTPPPVTARPLPGAGAEPMAAPAKSTPMAVSGAPSPAAGPVLAGAMSGAMSGLASGAPPLAAAGPRLMPQPAPRPAAPQVQPAVKRPVAPRPALAEEAPRVSFDETTGPVYELPPLGLLTSPSTIQRNQLSTEALEENARMLESVLDDYGVRGEIVSVRPGPVVTQYELEPAPGLKASRVIGLSDDIARSMSALSARVSTVPGRTVIGIELPNATREKVVLREILSAREFGDSAMRLPLALGKDIAGEPVIANLAKMPHLLIAGTTGSGKSVAINTMILSLLYKLTPDECRLIMIDPKMLELSVYDGIPHLLSPVVTDPKKAVVALKWVVSEMEDRYRKMSKMGVRNIEGYNGRVREALAKNEMFKRTIQTGFDEDTGEPVFETDEFAPVTLPYIVVVVDEMADLMMVAGKEIEACIQRLAQMARASGIHLIMATQRPSVDVITGTIKANFPTRISFQVTSRIDSRTILGEQGAEQLLGMGDMLYMAGGAKITRIHGPFVSDEEVEEIVAHLKSFGPPEYMSGVVEGPEDENAAEIDSILGLGSDGLDDSLYDQAVAIVAKDRKCSTSYIQRKLGIGYNKAAKLVEQMEEHGVVTPANHVGKREILVEER